jgi:hypothetical protein
MQNSESGQPKEVAMPRIMHLQQNALDDVAQSQIVLGLGWGLTLALAVVVVLLFVHGPQAYNDAQLTDPASTIFTPGP